MITELKPSIQIWEWYTGDITLELIISAIADKIAGYHISMSSRELLKDLGFLTDTNDINKLGKRVLANCLHDRYHHEKESVVIIKPCR